MSSMKTTTNLSNSGMNMEFIRYMKCAGALVNPNDNPILIQPIPGGEGSVRNVFRVDADLVITQTKIDLGKDISTGKLVKKNVDSHGGGSSMVGGEGRFSRRRLIDGAGEAALARWCSDDKGGLWWSPTR
jgi:hypothetical protein